MITCHNLVKAYKDKQVLNNLSFHIKEGEIYGLLGPNGAGKTTTIKMILGLSKLDAGSVEIDQGIHIGYQPETPFFHTYLTAYEVMKFYGQLQKISKDDLDTQIQDALDSVGLKMDQYKQIKTYSKGMLQRLAFAQALLGHPKLLILDEPSAGLDVIGRIQIRKLILKLKKEGRTILLNSHILSDVESVADRVGIIHQGQLVKEIDLKLDEGIHLENEFIKAVGGQIS